MNKRITYLILLTFFNYLQAQNNNDYEKAALEAIQAKEIPKAWEAVSKLDKNLLSAKIITWDLLLLESGTSEETLHSQIVRIKSSSAKDSIYKLLHEGEYNLLSNRQDVAYQYLAEAFELAKDNSDSLSAYRALYKLNFLSNKNENLRYDLEELITYMDIYAYNDLQKVHSKLIQHVYDVVYKKETTAKSLLNNLKLAKDVGNEFCVFSHYKELGLSYGYDFKKPDSSLYYHKLASAILNRYPDYHFVLLERQKLYNNIACTYFDQKEYSKSLKLFHKAYTIKSNKKHLKNDSIITDWLAKTHYKLKNLDSAYYYAQKKDTISRELGQATYAANIEEYKRKYDVSEEQKKTLLADRKRIANKNMAILLTIILGGVLIIGILVYRNLKRKQLLTEREKQLEAEKLEKLLNEQELAGINAMVEGQEKERKRIANELHDDLGSSMATLRLYAENARTKNEQVTQIHDKMLTIIDEVYKRVRGMAHTRNSGVKGSKGLLPAIQLFAQKISDSKQLQVEVTAFGMNTYYESELELEIFRIIKELITNVIKHAEATEILIQLTQHDNYLNIIVQDDGKGFNVKTINQTDGMGLYSIEKRIESKNGTMDIDSSFAHGTTIMLNIPSSS